MLQETQFIAASDITTVDGHNPAPACNIDKYALSEWLENETTLKLLGDVCFTPEEQITGMCVEGALLRAADGDLGSFILAKESLADVLDESPAGWFDGFIELEADKLGLSDINSWLEFQDSEEFEALQQRWRDETFDALLTASKNLEEEGL